MIIIFARFYRIYVAIISKGAISKPVFLFCLFKILKKTVMLLSRFFCVGILCILWQKLFCFHSDSKVMRCAVCVVCIDRSIMNAFFSQETYGASLMLLTTTVVAPFLSRTWSSWFFIGKPLYFLEMALGQVRFSVYKMFFYIIC